ncbi:XIAP-associated factor 1 [Toxotes jaculatrix]|uniref:XIAP-associated factor 1 n=1 Tax=Toxotes jaculatrix TaxID=941984 RepID=UPI001B3B18BD|nr:XIAP-associated factor 1 [Toxotes jaculatrix]
MDNKEATRTCGQCHKEVAEANFSLHETHCSRFLCLCPDCDEPVPKEQLNQHREEEHSQVRCSKCHQKMQRCQLMDHESHECVERLQTCQFCELEMPWKELDGHCVVCGSRTNLCRDCNRYVKLRDQPEHSLTCSATDNGSGPPQTTSIPPNKIKCTGCMASFPAEDIEKHKQECVPAPRWDYYKEVEPKEEELSSTFKDRLHSGPWDDGGDPTQISTCPHCHLALPLFVLRWHEAKCKIYICLK